MTVKDRDGLDHAVVKMRSLFMAIKGADSLMDRDEADALEALAARVLHDFERVKSAVESAPTLHAADSLTKHSTLAAAALSRLFFSHRWVPSSRTQLVGSRDAGRRFMRRRIFSAVPVAAALFGVIAAPALAQNSEAAPGAAAPMKSKPKMPGGTVTVKVTNWREADLVELQVLETGSANWKKVLGALKAGQWTWAKLPLDKNCHVDLRGKYADGKSADVSNVDIWPQSCDGDQRLFGAAVVFDASEQRCLGEPSTDRLGSCGNFESVRARRDAYGSLPGGGGL